MMDSAPLRGSSFLALVLLAALPSACRSSEARASIVISELMASNSSGLKDGDGETSDWIEVYNRGKVAVNLAGWRLTDDPSQTERWFFPDVSLEPGKYLLVFASGKPPTPGDHQLHASFKLKASPDYLALLDADGHVAQEFAPYPEQQSDVSFGLGSDGLTGYLSAPTPGAANAPAITKKAKNKGSAQRESDGELAP
jgi:hypothetical protein